MATAEAHYEPGEFTTLMGWEWSALPGGANLHRVVVTDADADQARSFQPFSALQSPYPEDLWQWLDQTSIESGARFLAIPPQLQCFQGPDVLRYDATRSAGGYGVCARTHALGEDRRSHPDQGRFGSALPCCPPRTSLRVSSPFRFIIQRDVQEYVPRSGDYVRSALKTGLQLGAKVGINPFQFGLIGSTDSHTGLSTAEENSFGGKMATDSTPETKLGSGAGFGGDSAGTCPPRVWRRYGLKTTLGRQSWAPCCDGRPMPRRVRASGSVSTAVGTFPTTTCMLRRKWIAGYRARSADGRRTSASRPRGCTELPGGSGKGSGRRKPRPRADRQRLAGRSRRGPGTGVRRGVVRRPAARRGRQRCRWWAIPWITRTARYDNSTGAAELAVVWRDPAFAAEQPAFYYVRVLEIPTPRHSLYDALALGMEAPDVGPSVIQERAYTSPIWYHPPTSEQSEP